jgi:hypothetical protein
VGLLAGSAVLHVVKGLDVEEALTEAFLAGLLSGQAGHFPGRAAAGQRPSLLGPALTVAGATLAYGTLGLIANDREWSLKTVVDRPIGHASATAGEDDTAQPGRHWAPARAMGEARPRRPPPRGQEPEGSRQWVGRPGPPTFGTTI